MHCRICANGVYPQALQRLSRLAAFVGVEGQLDALGPEVPLATDQRQVVLFGLAFTQLQVQHQHLTVMRWVQNP